MKIAILVILTIQQTCICVDVYNQRKITCGYGGSRANCDPQTAGDTVAVFMPENPASDFCFLTDTDYASGSASCREIKLYGNGVMAFSTGGLYHYTNRQSSRNQYERGSTEYKSGGGGGWGTGHSQGGSFEGGETSHGTDFYVLRQSKPNKHFSSPANSAASDHYDWYELRDGIYRFGYYDCGRIVEGGSIDDYQYHYFCSNGFDLFQGCRAKCGVGNYATELADYRTFNFTSSLFGEIEETQTSQIFS